MPKGKDYVGGNNKSGGGIEQYCKAVRGATEEFLWGNHATLYEPLAEVSAIAPELDPINDQHHMASAAP